MVLCRTIGIMLNTSDKVSILSQEIFNLSETPFRIARKQISVEYLSAIATLILSS